MNDSDGDDLLSDGGRFAIDEDDGQDDEEDPRQSAMLDPADASNGLDGEEDSETNEEDLLDERGLPNGAIGQPKPALSVRPKESVPGHFGQYRLCEISDHRPCSISIEDRRQKYMIQTVSCLEKEPPFHAYSFSNRYLVDVLNSVTSPISRTHPQTKQLSASNSGSDRRGGVD